MKNKYQYNFDILCNPSYQTFKITQNSAYELVLKDRAQPTYTYLLQFEFV